MMFIFQVHHYIKREHVGAYKAALMANVTGSLKEPGVVRFEVFQDKQDPTHFCLFEIYADEAARQSHLETAHFNAWKEVYFSSRERVGTGYQFEALNAE